LKVVQAQHLDVGKVDVSRVDNGLIHFTVLKALFSQKDHLLSKWVTYTQTLCGLCVCYSLVSCCVDWMAVHYPGNFLVPAATRVFTFTFYPNKNKSLQTC